MSANDHRPAVQALFALASGTLFGLGLAISGMIDPAKVLGFLDVAGDWDPTLALVMLGALGVTMPAFRLVIRRPRPWFGERFALPERRDLNSRLTTGAALFGIGWGLAGFCPGPALAALVAGEPRVYVFVAAMIVGFIVYSGVDKALRSRPRGGDPLAS